MRAASGSCQEFGLYSTGSCMASFVWSIQHRQLYGNFCLVYTAQTAVQQFLFGLYSTKSCMTTSVLSIQHKQLYVNFCLAYTAQTAVQQLLFGLYNTDSCMATSLQSIQHRDLYGNFSSLDNTLPYTVSYTPSPLHPLHILIP